MGLRCPLFQVTEGGGSLNDTSSTVFGRLFLGRGAERGRYWGRYGLSFQEAFGCSSRIQHWLWLTGPSRSIRRGIKKGWFAVGHPSAVSYWVLGHTSSQWIHVDLCRFSNCTVLLYMPLVDTRAIQCTWSYLVSKSKILSGLFETNQCSR